MRFRKLMVLAPFALAACATMGGGGGAAQATALVNELLTRAGAIAREQGYSVAAAPTMGSLNNRATEDVGLTLNAGREYLMVGVCDGDCSDLDLVLVSPTGQQVAADLEADDTPVLEFRAPATGNHRLQVVMATCSVNPCYYGVSLYAK